MKSTERCLSVASRTLNRHNIYGFSLNIGPYRKFDSKGYNKYTNEEQKQIILNILQNESMDVLGEPMQEYVFELTEKKNIHIHGIVFTTEANMKLLQKAINEKYGYKKDPINRVFDYSRTIIHRSFWDKYMQKDQKNDHEKFKSNNYIPKKPMAGLIPESHIH